jgi:hypothetical protein
VVLGGELSSLCASYSILHHPFLVLYMYQHVDGGYAAVANRRIQEADDRVPEQIPRRARMSCLVVTKPLCAVGLHQASFRSTSTCSALRAYCVYTVQIQEKLSCSSRSESSAQNHCMRMRWSTANVDRH